MYYKYSIAILSDGKIVKAQNNKTGAEAIARCSPEDKFNLSIGASLAIKRLLEKEDVLKVGDRVQFTDKFDSSFVYPYAPDFVEKLDIPISLKIRYCYSVYRPPLNYTYIVYAIKDNKAYIQPATGWNGCFLVEAKILKVLK